MVIGGVRTALRRAAQSLQRTEPPAAKPTASGTVAQLESTEPVASTLPAPDGAPAPAQQSDRGSSARAVRFYLGVTPHPGVLSRARAIRNELVIRGEQYQQTRRTHTHTTRVSATPNRSKEAVSEATGHGSQPTSSR